MAAILSLFKNLRSEKRGSAAVEFVATAAMLILTVAILISAMVYVTVYYNASYICRRAVRTIEVTGEYDAQDINALANSLGGQSMDHLAIQVEAHYVRGHCIQLRDEFTVTLTADYPIPILMFGSRPLTVRLPISIRLSGRSEVYWK